MKRFETLDTDWTATDIGGDDWRIVNSFPGVYRVWRNGLEDWVNESSHETILEGAHSHAFNSFHDALTLVYSVAQAFPPGYLDSASKG